MNRVHPPRTKVLIAHDDALISAGLTVILRRRRDFEVVVGSPPSAVSGPTVSQLPSADVVISDYDSGLRLIGSAEPGTHRVIVLTHSDSEANISRALEMGVRGYLLFGCSVQDLVDALRSVHAGGVALAPQVASRIADWMQQQALTLREEAILRQMTLGLSNKLIARKLALAAGTVKTHVKSILNKLDAASRTAAVAIAQRRGILREEQDTLDGTRTTIFEAQTHRTPAELSVARCGVLVRPPL